VLVTLTFFLMRAAPGGPFDRARVLRRRSRSRSLRLIIWTSRCCSSTCVTSTARARDLGPSFQYEGYSVAELIASGFPVSLELGLCAMLLALLVGGAAGIAAALQRNGLIDFGVMTLAMTGISVPSFVLAPLLILGFAVTMGWLARRRMGSRRLAQPDPAGDRARASAGGHIARLMRGAMIEVLAQNYIRTARAKGLAGHQIIFRHALKPALIPVLSHLGPAVAA